MFYLTTHSTQWAKEGNVLFNDALNTLGEGCARCDKLNADIEFDDSGEDKYIQGTGVYYRL